MDFKIVNKITGFIVFVFSSVIYVITVQPTLSFWDCGEFLACAYTLSTPHPPGAPLHLLVGRFFTLLPTATDIGLRMNYLSVFSSSFSVLFLYLISVKVIKNWRGIPQNSFDILIICIASAVGALSYAFCDSFWFNAMEAEVYGFGTFLIALCIYIMMVWWEKADEKGSDKLLLFIIYIVGLSIGIHLLVVQCIFILGLIYYFRKYEYNSKSFWIAVIISALAFFVVYPIIVKKYTHLIADSYLIGALILISIVIGFYYYTFKKKSTITSFALLSIILVVLGFSTYISVLLRSNVDNLPLDENNPDTMERLIPYLNREQYGEQPLIWPRRYSNEPQHERTRQLYSSDLQFMWKYQINEMFNRYLFWQYIGRAGYDQGDGVDFSKFFAIPFVLGMFGVFYHFRKDWKLGLIYLIMFLMMGVLTALYQNQQDPQPRERDYFYEGAFFVFSMWIGFGVVGLVDSIKNVMNRNLFIPAASIIMALSFVFVPLRMLQVNYPYQSRKDNYFPYDYAYNLLQSVDKDGIIFTNGDNDTFPLWCLQAAYGVRTDVKIVNLSLAQTDWYNIQLKNERPYGSLPVPYTYTDEQLKRIQPIQWDENKVITIEIPLKAYPDSMRNNNPNLPTRLSFKVPATIRQQQGKQVITAVKANDLIVLDIIKANKWERPIYFSITVTEDNYVGLGDYLLYEGMAQRLVPYKTVTESGIAVNKEVLRKNLFDIPETPSKTPRYGYIFRGLDNKNLFFDQVHKRAIETYRTLFLRLAYAYAEDSTKLNLADEVISEMEKKIPSNVIDMDYRIMYDAAMLSHRIGNFQRYNEYAAKVEYFASEDIKRNPKNVSTFYNPYRILLDIYEHSGKYQQALDILNKLQELNPGDPSVKQKMESIKQILSGNTPGNNK